MRTARKLCTHSAKILSAINLCAKLNAMNKSQVTAQNLVQSFLRAHQLIVGKASEPSTSPSNA